MSEAETAAGLTAEHLEKGAEHPTLGPAYFAAREIAERFTAHFENEHFKPLIDKAAEQFRETLWTDIAAWLIEDTENNLANQIQAVVDDTVKGLCGGFPWALQKYAFGEYHDGKKIRETIFEQCRDQLTDKRIEDLESEIASLKDQLQWSRR